jgi:hypothetical protein
MRHFLPGLVCGGSRGGGAVTNEVWRLHLATLRWEPMPALVTARVNHACCAVRGSLVVLGGRSSDGSLASSVEMLSSEAGAFVELPPLLCGAIHGAVAIPVEESDSALGQVLLLGGMVSNGSARVSTVRLVDLATGVCTPAQVPDLLSSRCHFAAERLPDGRIVCVGGTFGGDNTLGEVYGPPESEAPDAAWAWRQLPAMSVGRGAGCGGGVISDGRFAVLGGWSSDYQSYTLITSSCELLITSDDDEHWEPLLPMHDSRRRFACEAVAGCIIVAGGLGRSSAEVYDGREGEQRVRHTAPSSSSSSSQGGAVRPRRDRQTAAAAAAAAAAVARCATVTRACPDMRGVSSLLVWKASNERREFHLLFSDFCFFPRKKSNDTSLIPKLFWGLHPQTTAHAPWPPPRSRTSTGPSSAPPGSLNFGILSSAFGCGLQALYDTGSGTSSTFAPI